MTPGMIRAFRRTALTVQRAFNQFDPTCRGADTTVIDGDQAPVFILSVPRSGTTMLYQLMARSMELSVITNLMALAPRYMLRLARISNAKAARDRNPLHPGTFGYLPGLHGLSEAGKVMERWFEPGAGPTHRQQVREMIAALTHRTGRPLLIKSLSLVGRLEAVAATVPHARIVRLHRDPRQVIRSLVRAQSDPRSAADQWEGVTPPGLLEAGDLGTVRRAAAQVAALSSMLHDASTVFDADSVLDVSYEDLCRAPQTVLARVAAGIQRPFNPRWVPEELKASTLRRSEDDDWAEIERACEDFMLLDKNNSNRIY